MVVRCMGLQSKSHNQVYSSRRGQTAQATTFGRTCIYSATASPHTEVQSCLHGILLWHLHLPKIRQREQTETNRRNVIETQMSPFYSNTCIFLTTKSNACMQTHQPTPKQKSLFLLGFARTPCSF